MKTPDGHTRVHSLERLCHDDRDVGDGRARGRRDECESNVPVVRRAGSSAARRRPPRGGPRAVFARWAPLSSGQSLWRNRLARSTVNRKVGGSSPPEDVIFYFLTI